MDEEMKHEQMNGYAMKGSAPNGSNYVLLYTRWNMDTRNRLARANQAFGRAEGATFSVGKAIKRTAALTDRKWCSVGMVLITMDVKRIGFLPS